MYLGNLDVCNIPNSAAALDKAIKCGAGYVYIDPPPPQKSSQADFNSYFQSLCDHV
jgi:hypothetical protein